MPIPWFTSKGQALGFFASSIAGIIGIAGWFSLRPEHVFNGVPNWVLIFLIVIACIVAVASATAFAGLSGKSESPPRQTAPAPLQKMTTAPVEPAAQLHKTDVAKNGGHMEAHATVTEHVLKVGERRQIVDDDLSPITVTVHQVRKFEKDDREINFLRPTPDYEAELHVKTSGGLILGGAMAKETGTNRFLVPAYSDGFGSEVYSLFTFHYSVKHFGFLTLRVDHINMLASEVAISVCRADGRVRD